MEDLEGLRVVEALLFVSDEPLTTQRIAEVLDCDKREATRLVKSLAEKFNSNGRAVSVEEIAGGWQLRTKTDLAPWIRKYLATRPVRLSRAALEVMAVVAYRQPITRHEIESIRGVDCSAVLQSLLERKLIKIMGRKDVPGRPIIYGTTRQFLEHFNLSDLAQLPDLREFEEPPGGHAKAPEDGDGESDQSEQGTTEGSFARGATEAEEENEAGIDASEETEDRGFSETEDEVGDAGGEEARGEAFDDEVFDEDDEDDEDEDEEEPDEY